MIIENEKLNMFNFSFFNDHFFLLFPNRIHCLTRSFFTIITCIAKYVSKPSTYTKARTKKVDTLPAKKANTQKVKDSENIS